MVPGFGVHFRIYRLRVALDRLRAMPPGTTLTATKAAHLLGISEAAVKALVRRHGTSKSGDSASISAAQLRFAVQKEHEARRRG